MINKTSIALLVGIALSASPLAHADTTLSTLGSWNGVTEINPFGGPGGAASTYGETFIAPTDSVLQSFTFEFNQVGNTSITADVYAWSGSLFSGSTSLQGATGSPLFSTPETLVGTGAFAAETINTGGVDLTAGQAYVILFNDPTEGGAHASFGLTDHEAGDGGGGLNFAFLGPVPTNGNWHNDAEDFGDLAFSATFTAPAVASPVPEPGSLALLGTGLFGGLGMVRRKLHR
jgi:hypothetical protein